MPFVVNFTDREGIEKNRVIPVKNRCDVWDYFKHGRRYENSKVHKIWSAKQFGETIERYVSYCEVPQKLNAVGYYGNKKRK